MKTSIFFALALSLFSSNSILYAQAFTPINGTAYPVEFTEWTLNGVDRLHEMESNLRSATITFNSNNTILNFRNALFNATYTFFPNGSCEFFVRVLFIRRTVLGTGRIERSGRDFTLFISLQEGGEDMVAVIKGSIGI
jgi:hypothetical protein